MSVNFVAIDFETASSDRNSACALGAAIVRDGSIVERKYSLLNPHMPFESYSIHIHGITEEAVQHAPDFAQIYPTVYDLLHEQIVAAHNTSFDMAVLAATCESRCLPLPAMQPFDSVRMAEQAWPNLERYKLSILAQHFGFPLKHHNAVEDATVCALLILKACEDYQADSLEALRRTLQRQTAQRHAHKKGVTEISLLDALDPPLSCPEISSS